MNTFVTVERLTPWSLALDVARNTMGKGELNKEPSSQWKQKMLLCEHSPIRCVIFHVRIENLPSWVSVHLVRHKIGVEHFVQSQRTDRTGIDRNSLPQNAPVTHDMILNAQAFIAISRKRLCNLASPETRAVWQSVVAGLCKIGELELARACVPECAHQGDRCPELKPCGKCKPIFEG